jgi:hypothetical protein
LHFTFIPLHSSPSKGTLNFAYPVHQSHRKSLIKVQRKAQKMTEKDGLTSPLTAIRCIVLEGNFRQKKSQELGNNSWKFSYMSQTDTPADRFS